MSVTIRLARFGKKHAPSYRVVASVTRDKRNGKFLEVLGHYNPSEKQSKFVYDKAKFETFVKNGAIVSKAVEELIKGTYKYKKYDPSAKEETESPTSDEHVEDKEEPKKTIEPSETKEPEESADTETRIDNSEEKTEDE